MSDAHNNLVRYQRANFTDHLSASRLYSPTHYWLERKGENVWRIGLTKFATRMLGEMVDYGFEAKPGQPVTPGQVLGWMEGFKAVSDVYCIATGTFLALNPLLDDRVTLINQDPYGEGWVYEIAGTPDERCYEVKSYCAHLDATIERLRQKTHGPAPQSS